MPAPVDLSFDRFLKPPLPSSPRSNEANKLDRTPRQQPMSTADDGESEVDRVRGAPLLSSSSSRPLLNVHLGRTTARESRAVDRTIDEDYDGIDGSSDTEPIPQTPFSSTSYDDHSSAPSVKYEADDDDEDLKIDFEDTGYDSSSSEDRPLASPASTSRAQEQPSIATIEDEEEPSDSGGLPRNPRSVYTPAVPMQRHKYRSYRDQHSAVPMPCLIDDCKHSSWMSKEREKHMDTHFHKRWQCGSCKRWYSTSYTLKRHSDSTHVPEACKGAYEAGNYVSVPPYWTIPEFVHRVRMPEESDYLYPLLARVFKERDELQAKGLLHKRSLPEAIQMNMGAIKQRTRRQRAPRKSHVDMTVPPAAPSPSAMEVDADPRRSSAPLSSDEQVGRAHSMLSDRPETPPDDDVESGKAEKVEDARHSAMLVEEQVPVPVDKRKSARDLCLEHWVVEHPDGTIDAFDKYWAQAGDEEKHAYELLSTLRGTRRT